MPERDLSTDPLLANVPAHKGYKVLGGVVLYQKLGQGGMGAVYKGRHLRLDIDVALKVTTPPPALPQDETDSFIQRFVRSFEPEIRAQAKNGSPRSTSGASGQRPVILRARA